MGDARPPNGPHDNASSASRPVFRAPSAATELTWTAALMGLTLSVIMGAANVYLGLRVGMTVSASIPAAVIAMAILNGVMRRESIREANLVQTSASAGESLAAGIIFTVPALVIVGVWETFDYWTTTVIALTGGLLGVLLMIPMRKVFIVDSPELQFPEGVACAEVLKTGARSQGGAAESRSDERNAESGGGPQIEKAGTAATGASVIFVGLVVGAVFKICQSFLGLLVSQVQGATVYAQRIFYFGADIAPSLLAVGLIVGLPIAFQVFVGGAISWLIAIPILSHQGLSSGTLSGSPLEAAEDLWKTQIRYMGVGAMVVGGVSSIWRVRGGLAAAVRELAGQYRMRDGAGETAETDRNIDSRAILALSIFSVLMITSIYHWLLQSLSVTLLTTAIMLVMAFFFTGVASYIVGLVGNSNSPVSGMTITAVLATAGLISLFNFIGIIDAEGDKAIVATLGVAGIVCCVACTSGDVCNDLKTGLLVGASPRLQQWMQIGGVLVAAFVMAPVLTVLHEGSVIRHGENGGIGVDPELSAPQATLMANLARGFFRGEHLPWDMVAWGAGIGVMLLIGDWVLTKRESRVRLHVMPVAVGMYLPFGLSATMLAGGFLHFGLSRFKTSGMDRATSASAERGTLAASGVIAGEALLGVALGITAYYGVRPLDLASRWRWGEATATVVSVVALSLVAFWMFAASARRPK